LPGCIYLHTCTHRQSLDIPPVYTPPPTHTTANYGAAVQLNTPPLTEVPLPHFPLPRPHGGRRRNGCRVNAATSVCSWIPAVCSWIPSGVLGHASPQLDNCKCKHTFLEENGIINKLMECLPGCRCGPSFSFGFLLSKCGRGSVLIRYAPPLIIFPLYGTTRRIIKR